MADELTMSASVAYSDSDGTEVSIALTNVLTTLSTQAVFKQRVSVGTSEQALDLGNIASMGVCVFVNRSTTRTINLKTGTGGTVICSLLPGQFAVIPMGTGVTAPYVVALVGAAVLEYMIVSL